MRKSKCTKEKLLKVIPFSKSYAEVLRALDLEPKGGNYATLKRKISEFSIDVSHFTGQGWRKYSKTPVCKAQDLGEILVKDSHYKSYHLRKRLIQEGLKMHICEQCGLSNWNGVLIPLELDHINGDRTDNRFSNLRLLCPNCHALTPTYRGRNLK